MRDSALVSPSANRSCGSLVSAPIPAGLSARLNQSSAHKKRARRLPSAPQSFAVWRRLHLLAGIRSSSSSVGRSGSGFRSSASSGGRGGRSSVGRGGSSGSGFRSGVGCGGSSFSSSVRSGGSGVFSLAASRESESGAGSSGDENDLAHVWYSLNSEWTPPGPQHKAYVTVRKANLYGRLRRSNNALRPAMQAIGAWRANFG